MIIPMSLNRKKEKYSLLLWFCVDPESVHILEVATNITNKR